MTAPIKIVSLHIVALILCAPLFLAYASNDGEPMAESVLWIIGSSAMVYFIVSVAGRPKPVFDGAFKLGITYLPMRLTFLSVSLIMICVPLLDNKAEIYAIAGVLCMASAACLFVVAVTKTYLNNESNIAQ